LSQGTNGPYAKRPRTGSEKKGAKRIERQGTSAEERLLGTRGGGLGKSADNSEDPSDVQHAKKEIVAQTKRRGTIPGLGWTQKRSCGDVTLRCKIKGASEAAIGEKKRMHREGQIPRLKKNAPNGTLAIGNAAQYIGTTTNSYQTHL